MQACAKDEKPCMHMLELKRTHFYHTVQCLFLVGKPRGSIAMNKVKNVSIWHVAKNTLCALSMAVIV